MKRFTKFGKRILSLLLAVIVVAGMMPDTNASAAAPLENGYYYIASGLKSDGSFLADVAGGSTSYGARIQAYEKNRSLAQVFYVSRNSDGSYTIKNVKSGLVWDIPCANAKCGQYVQQYKSNSSSAQKFYLESAGNGCFYIRTALHSNLYVDVANASTSNSTPLQLFWKNGSKRQQFKFIPVIQANSESISGGMNTVSVRGWAFSDLNHNDQLKITVSFAGRTFTTYAKSYRPDVNRVFGAGNYHGYSASFTVQGLSGNQNVVVKATDSAGRTRVLAQKNVYIQPDNYNPSGSFDSISYSNGAVTLAGWTWDQSDPDKSIDYAVFFNGQFAGTFKANKARSDLRSALPGQAGINHGFTDTVKLPAGMSGLVKVAVTGINTGGGQNTLIGEKQLFIKPGYDSYSNKVTAFINDARWKNGAVWSANQMPKVSGHQSWGCCAYAADFAKVVFGKSSQSSGTPFNNVSSIKAGDVIHVNNSTHWFVVLDRIGDQLITAEGNWGGKVIISSNTYSIVNNTIHRNDKEFRPMITSYHYT